MLGLLCVLLQYRTKAVQHCHFQPCLAAGKDRADEQCSWRSKMTAVECINAVRFAVWHVFRIRGLTLLQRLQLALLKIVAVCGYHYGKYLSYTESSAPIASRQEALQALHAVNRSVLSMLRLLLTCKTSRVVRNSNTAMQGGQKAT